MIVIFAAVWWLCGIVASAMVEIYFEKKWGDTSTAEYIISGLLTFLGPITLIASVVFLCNNDGWKYLK